MATAISSKIDLRKLSKAELAAHMKDLGQPSYRADQIYDWLWKKGAHDVDDMTNLSKTLRESIKDKFVINHTNLHDMQRSKDGTIKNAVRLHDGFIVESVLIPTASRTTACVSSQVGCSLNCAFCATARLKRMRNLEPDEIYDQVVMIDRQSREDFNRPLSNIVFMGMGEPLMNFKNLLKSVEKITGDDALGMSPRRITVSTSGIPKMIKKLADEQPKFHLALSLHSAIDEKRTQIMPFNEQFPLADIADALKYWYNITRERVTYEYVVWKGINDGPEDIDALIDFCRIIPCKVNLIQYNSIGDDRFEQASDQAIDYYISALRKAGQIVNVRRSRGDDIDAACGQLANKNTAV
jgi:23S rRNA (adenine2503-C2)-methyltransferase